MDSSRKPAKSIKTVNPKIIIIAVSLVVLLATILIIIIQPFNEKKKDAKALISSINKTQNLDSILIVTNFQYTYIQNGKENKTITQGVYSSLNKKKDIMLKGNITFTSTINSNNNFETDFDLMKKDGKLFEKTGSQYQPSQITAEEFSKLADEFKIYNFEYKSVKSIKKTVSIDRSQTVYEVELSKIPDKLKKNYIESINDSTGEDFKEKDLKVTSVSLISSVSKSILRSQQLRISLEAKSKTNSIQIGFVSEINIAMTKYR